MTDSSGAVVWSADYKPFGEATVTISTITNNLRFPGQYFDQETGLHYNYFRDYDSVIGKYKQADPIGLAGGINPFRYVGNNPTNRRDYYGLLEDGQEYTGKKTDPHGHSDLPGYPTFDWTSEDHNWSTSPINPFGGMCRHFRPLGDIVDDIKKSINKCDKKGFEGYMHQGHDYFTHYSKGYRCETLGHALDSLKGKNPDDDYQAWLRAKNFTEKMLKLFSDTCPMGQWGDITIRWY